MGVDEWNLQVVIDDVERRDIIVVQRRKKIRLNFGSNNDIF